MATHPHIPFILESATTNDIDEIVSLENRVYQFPWTRNVLLSEINGKSFSHVYVARLHTDNGTAGPLIGYNFFWLAADEIHILNIAVDPDYQGKGIGTSLMQFAVQLGLKRGAAKAFLEVRASNIPALRLYTKLGFTQIGLRKHYYSDNKEDAYVMQKLLTNIDLPDI